MLSLQVYICDHLTYTFIHYGPHYNNGDTLSQNIMKHLRGCIQHNMPVLLSNIG